MREMKYWMREISEVNRLKSEELVFDKLKIIDNKHDRELLQTNRRLPVFNSL